MLRIICILTFEPHKSTIKPKNTIMENPLKTEWLTVNRACDMRCKGCYASSTGYIACADMKLDLAKRLTFLVKDVGVKSIILIGGEPTLWKDLFEFNDFCRELNLKTVLVTNGRQFRLKKFTQEFKLHPSNVVAPSLKAFDELSCFSITALKDFDGVKSGIKNICDMSNTYVSIVYSTQIQGRLVDMVETAVGLGAFGVRVSTCTPMSENGKFTSPYTVDYDVMVAEISGCYEKLVELTKGNLSLDIKTPFCIWPRDFIDNLIRLNQVASGCQFFRRSGVIFDTDGTAILCNSMFDCPVGKFDSDFSDAEGLLALINSEKVKSIYRHITSYPSKACVDCDLYVKCRGGCPIMWTTHNAEEIISGAKNKQN